MAEKILIVDDDLETLRLVGLMLQRQGYQISSAQNGSEGLRQAKAEKPNLIVLDLMMPDIDGFQVTRQLKSDPPTANIPILVFTAKSQVDDKIAGYEAGADDYLTKPVHPNELVAHIKALLSRKKTQTPQPSQKKATVLGIIAPKGGMGVSSLALNLAILLEPKIHTEVIAAELRPGQGTWAGELNFANPNGLTNILTMPLEQINPVTVGAQLVRTTYGPRLLLATSNWKDFPLNCDSIQQLDRLLMTLSEMVDFLILDIGTPFVPGLEKILSHCDELIVLSEPQPFSLRASSQLCDELAQQGFGDKKPLSVAIVNRVRADLQLSASQIQEMLGQSIRLVIPPVPEASYHAALRNLPLCILQPEGIYAQQVSQLAAQLAESITK